jgi:hypothetical protein
MPQLPASNSNSSQELGRSSHSLTDQLAPLHSTQLHSLTFLLVISRHGSHRKHRYSVAVSVVACAAIGAEQQRFPASPLARVRNLLPSNGLCLQTHYLATYLHSAIIICIKWCCYLDVGKKKHSNTFYCHLLLSSSVPTRNYVLTYILTESKYSPFIGLCVNNLNWRMKVWDYDRSKNQMLLRAIFSSLQLWTPPLTNIKLTISLPKYIYFLFGIRSEFSLRRIYTNPRAGSHRHCAGMFPASCVQRIAFYEFISKYPASH